MPEDIPLPLFSDQAIGIIGNPTAPSNPPSVTDITNAMHNSRTLLNANSQKKVTNEDVVRSEKYKNQLLFASDVDIEPPWFAGAMDRVLAPIKADIRDMKGDIRDMKVDIQDLIRQQSQVWKLAARNHNLSLYGAGDEVMLEVVPFTNGRDPTKNPYNLPPLRCVGDVGQLSAQQRDKYYKGYYNSQLPLVNERVEKILLAIGAKVN